MCATTPALIHGQQFDSPTSCENRVRILLLLCRYLTQTFKRGFGVCLGLGTILLQIVKPSGYLVWFAFLHHIFPLLIVHL
jgi:hypothetical protein